MSRRSGHFDTKRLDSDEMEVLFCEMDGVTSNKNRCQRKEPISDAYFLSDLIGCKNGPKGPPKLKAKAQQL
jgi:hypothetical protein